MPQPVNEVNAYKDTLVDVFSSSQSPVKVKAVRIHKPDDTYNIRLHVENNGVLGPAFEFPHDKLRTKILEINNYSVPFNPIEISEIIQGIKKKFLKLSPIPTIDAFNKIGWHYDENDNAIYWKSAIGVDLQGRALVKDIYAPYPSYAGDLQANINYINKYISNHGVVAQAIILYGFSSVLVGYLHRQPDKNLLLSLSGKSSRGKTTISKLLVSLFAEPGNSKLSTTFNVTVNKMAERLDGINGAAVLIDDLSLAPANVKKDIQSMVYVLVEGKEKERIKTKTFDRDPATWATTIIFSAEESILSLCNPEQEGVIGRLMELNISPNDLFSDANEANQIQNLSHEHYGLLADEFVKRLISSNQLAILTNLYEQEKKNVRKNYSDAIARMAENVAVVTLCGKLLNNLFSFQFDIADIEEYLMATARDNLENFRISQKDNVIIKAIYPKLIEYAKAACPDENKGFTDHVVISSKATKQILTEIQKELGYKPIDIKRTLKDSGLLFATDRAFSYNGTINGKSFRGLYLYINTKETPDNE